MKTLLYFVLFALPMVCAAQNYNCLQTGVKRYYINGNGYLRGIDIDSTQTNGDTTTYYPFHTPRGPYYNTPFAPPALDSNGGSWLGGKVVKYSDGKFEFDNYWGNTVTIKTLAPTGSTWTFYSDSSTLYYQAEMLGTDTMTLLGSIDSVKTILITARNPSGIVTSDPLDSFQIILSKNHGFAQVFDLYTFLYHKPDSVYRPGLDFFLDRSTWTYGNVNVYGGNAPNKNITIFKLVDFINPNDVQLHNWNVGDVFEREYETGTIMMLNPPTSRYYTLDTITSVSTGSHSVTYTYGGNRFSYLSPVYQTPHIGSFTYYDTVYRVYENGEMPERKIDFNTSNYTFYFPEDTSVCIYSPLYINIPAQFSFGGLGSTLWQQYYKFRIGRTYYVLATGDPYYERERIVFSQMAGSGCGRYIWPVGIDNINAMQQLSIYPNPATDVLHIASDNKIGRVEITNLLGQVLLTADITDNTVQIDVGLLPVGCYIIREGQRVGKFEKL